MLQTYLLENTFGYLISELWYVRIVITTMQEQTLALCSHDTAAQSNAQLA